MSSTSTQPKGRRGGGKEEAQKQTKSQRDAPSEKTKNPTPKKKKDPPQKANTPQRPPGWWRTIDASDPITLDPLCELEYPPFELMRALGETYDVNETSTSTSNKKQINKTTNQSEDINVAHLFDPSVLAEYVVKSKQFENPLNRVPMTEKDCQRLDAHLNNYKLPKFNVFRTFIDAKEERKRAAAERLARENETAEAAQRRVEQLQSELAESLFMSLRARGARAAAVEREGRGGRNSERRRQQHGAQPAVTGEGGLVMVDDDQGMRGRTLVGASGGDGWQWEDASHLLQVPTEAFPALGGGGTGAQMIRTLITSTTQQTPRAGPGAFPALSTGSVPVSSSGGSLWSAMASSAISTPVPTARRPIRVQSILRRTEEEQPQALPTGPSASGEDDPAAARRKQLAEAFGVRRPDERPSVFAASALEQFTKELVKTARAFPGEIQKMEQQLERFVEGKKKKRISFDVAPRRIRAVGHALAKTYGCASCAYGNEPKRHIDVFRTDATSFPSMRLSDAVKYDAEQSRVENFEKKLDKKEREDKDAGVAVRLSVNSPDNFDPENGNESDHYSIKLTLGHGNSFGAGRSEASDTQTVQMSLSFAPDGARSSRTGPVAGDPWFPEWTEWYSRGKWSRLEIRFTDYDSVDVVKRSVSEFAGEFAWEVLKKDGSSGGSVKKLDEGDDLCAHFFRKETYDQVVGKIGGGARGRFRAKGFVERGNGYKNDAEDEAAPCDPLTAARRQAERAALALSGGRVGPRVPGAFGKGKETAESSEQLESAWDNEEDDDDDEHTMNAFDALGEDGE